LHNDVCSRAWYNCIFFSRSSSLLSFFYHFFLRFIFTFIQSNFLSSFFIFTFIPSNFLLSYSNYQKSHPCSRTHEINQWVLFFNYKVYFVGVVGAADAVENGRSQFSLIGCKSYMVEKIDTSRSLWCKETQQSNNNNDSLDIAFIIKGVFP